MGRLSQEENETVGDRKKLEMGGNRVENRTGRMREDDEEDSALRPLAMASSIFLSHHPPSPFITKVRALAETRANWVSLASQLEPGIPEAHSVFLGMPRDPNSSPHLHGECFIS